MESETYTPFELGSSWQRILQDELSQPYLISLAAFVEQERMGKIPVYPPKELVFNAFQKTAYESVKVLIMGQDPYHGPGQAHGLSFSVPKGIPQPPSLQNIYKEIVADVGIAIPSHGCLISWANQGVMLLNATLTVRQGEPMSHHSKGWERFTDAVIAKLCERKDPVIFVLWGKSAQEKCRQITNPKEKSPHFVLKSPHPSPLSAHQGFLGCRHFSQINTLLVKQGKTEINWKIE
jgi:uracil-DNA glycosylase